MKGIPAIKGVMTPFPYSIGVDERLNAARLMMEERNIRHLPVIDGPRLAGVISDREIELALTPGIGGPDQQRLRVGDVCGRKPYIVELSEPLDSVLLRMASDHVDVALVVKEGRLAGIFTLTDVCRSYGRMLRALFPTGSDDAA